MNYKVVMHARVVLSDRERLLNSFIKRMAKRYVDQMVCIDGSVSNKLGSISSAVVYNPLHVNEKEIPDAERSSKESCTVLFLANLIAYKGLFDLLQAAILLRNDPKIKILIAGANSRPPSFFKTIIGKTLHALSIVQDNEKKMKSIIEVNRLKNVAYLGNIKNINEWLVNTDILVFPSHMNGPSRSIFEAGALGIPSIISLKDVVEDVVVHNKNGLIVPEKSPSKLAEAISYLAHDDNKRNALGNEAKSHFRNLNNPQGSAKKILTLYWRAINGHLIA